MDTLGELFMLLLAVIAAIHVQEITSASLGEVSISGSREKTRKREAEVVNHPPTSELHIASPCPDVLLSTKNNNKTNRWYGVVSITAKETINGIDLGIQLDKPAELLGTWFGEVSTDDNIHYTVSDGKMKILPGEIFAVRFFIKYNETEAEPPNVKAISLNGRQICPLKKDVDVSPTTPESLDPKDNTGSVPVTIVSSETTQSFVVDRSSAFPPQLPTPTTLTTLSSRHSRGSSNQHSTNRVHLDNSQVAYLFVSLLRRLARNRNASDDSSIPFDQVNKDSFGGIDGNPGAHREEDLEGLLNTLIGVLTKDEVRDLGAKVPDDYYVDEPETAKRTQFTSDQKVRPFLPKDLGQTTSIQTTIPVESNRNSDRVVGTVLEEQDFATDAPYTDYIDGPETAKRTHNGVNPTDPSLLQESRGQTIPVSTTVPVGAVRVSDKGGSVEAEQTFGSQVPDNYYVDDLEATTRAYFTYSPTNRPLFPKARGQATSGRVTVPVETNRVPGEGGSVGGGQTIVSQVPDNYYVDDPETTTRAHSSPTNRPLFPNAQGQTPSGRVTVPVETNHDPGLGESVGAEQAFGTEVPDTYYVDEPKATTRRHFISSTTDRPLFSNARERTSSVPKTSHVDTHRIPSKGGSNAGEHFLGSKAPENYYVDEPETSTRTHFSSNPTDRPSFPKPRGQNAPGRTFPGDTNRVSGKGGSMVGERTVGSVLPENYYLNEPETATRIHFTSNPTDRPLLSKVRGQATSVPATFPVNSNRISGGGGSTVGEQVFGPDVSEKYYVNEPETVTRTRFASNPTDRPLLSKARGQITSKRTTFSVETNRVSKERGSNVGGRTFGPEVPESYYVDEPETVTRTHFRSNPTERPLLSNFRGQSTSERTTISEETNRFSSEGGSAVGGRAFGPAVPTDYYIDGPETATRAHFTSNPTDRPLFPKARGQSTSGRSTVSVEANHLSGAGGSVVGGQAFGPEVPENDYIDEPETATRAHFTSIPTDRPLFPKSRGQTTSGRSTISVEANRVSGAGGSVVGGQAFGPEVPENDYIDEPETATRAHFTSIPTDRPLFPKSRGQTTSGRSTVSVEANHVSGAGESVVGGQGFGPEVPENYYVDEPETVTRTHSTSIPTDRPPFSKGRGPTTSIPTTVPFETDHVSVNGGRRVVEGQNFASNVHDNYFFDEPETVTRTPFTSNPTDRSLFPKGRGQTTSVPTTISVATNRVSGEGGSVVGQQIFRPEAPNTYYVPGEPETTTRVYFTPSPADRPSFPKAQDQTTSERKAVSEETNHPSGEAGSVVGERTFRPEFPENYYVDEPETTTRTHFTSRSTDGPLFSGVREQTSSVPETFSVDKNRLSPSPVRGGEQAYQPEDSYTYYVDEAEDGDGVMTLFTSGPTNPSLSPETQEHTSPVSTTVDAGTNRFTSEAGAVDGEDGHRGVDPPRSTSPCPGVFSYFNHLAGSDVWYGNLTVTSDEDLIGLRLDIELNKRSQGLGALLGDVTTKDNIHYTIWNASATIDPRESIYIYFFVKYDHEEGAPPTIKSIRLNGMKICSAKKVEISTVPAATSGTFGGESRPLSNHGITFETTTYSQHQQPRTTTYAPTYISERKNGLDEPSGFMQHQQPFYTQGITATEQGVIATEPVTPSSTSHTSAADGRPYDREINLETTSSNIPTDPPTNKSERKNSVEESSEFVQRQQQPAYASTINTTELGGVSEDDDACGQIEIEQPPVTTFAKDKAKERWPWHAAIYQIRGDNLYYICGGTLVGKRTILTAARCLNDGQSDGTLSPKSLAVYVGKYSLARWDGAVQYREVKEIHVHPEFDTKNIHGDIAVLILSNPVDLSAHVQPVCLGDGRQTGLSGGSQEGVVVGWGFDRHGNVSDELTVSRMPVLSLRTCSSRYPKIFNYALSDKIYCAGYRSRTTMCSGESGDGMFFASADHPGGADRRGVTPRWTIRGVASFTLSRKSGIGCSDRNYVVFSDITKYYDWIGKYR